MSSQCRCPGRRHCQALLIVPLSACLAFSLWISEPAAADNGETTTPVVSMLSGCITDPANHAVPQARIIAMGRESDEKLETVTDSSGCYTLPVVAGSYDLGVFTGDFVTDFTGPIIVNHSGSRHDVRLITATEVAGDHFSGRILSNGQPLAGIIVRLRPNNGSPATFPYDASTVTDQEGRFDFGGIPASYFNVHLSGPGMEYEAVDLVKNDMAAYAELQVNTPYRNAIETGYEALPPDQFAGEPNTEGRCEVNLTQPLISKDKDASWYLVNGCGVANFVTHMGQNEISAQTPCPIRCWEIKVEGTWDRLTVDIWAMNFTGYTGWITYYFHVTGGANAEELTMRGTGRKATTFKINRDKGEKPELKQIVYDYGTYL